MGLLVKCDELDKKIKEKGLNVSAVLETSGKENDDLFIIMIEEANRPIIPHLLHVSD